MNNKTINDELRKALNFAFLTTNTLRNEIDAFKNQARELLNSLQINESEEFHKNNLSDFLKNAYYKGKHYINVRDKNDLVIHNDKTVKSSVGVIIEVKRPSNKIEMLTRDNLNKKALQELVLYYLRERIIHKNLQLKHLIVTNISEWFIFDAHVFESCFAENKELVKLFNDFENGTLAGHKTKSFYDEIASPVIEACQTELAFVYFNLVDYRDLIENTADKEKDKLLIPLFKILSPEHLLKLSFSNDANSLNKEFYHELLHIIGLEEIKESGKKIITRKSKQPNAASMMEQVIDELKTRGIKKEHLFELAIELSITWINRILFLKLLETQLMSYHDNDKSYQFLDNEKITCFNDLNRLFFQVLAIKPHERSEQVKQYFPYVPYLNSSLFERIELEKQIDISHLSRLAMPLFSATVLKNEQAQKRTGELDLLSYLFQFLEAYNFSSEGKETIQEDNKTLISASVLGLIFEKINGYKDGSFFTPSVITMYMSRETLRLAVLQKFNAINNWQCENFIELHNKINNIKQANDIINSLRICDPSVGSGHFLVSVLNEMIAIKSELGILHDETGKLLKYYKISVHNDELKVTDIDNDSFQFEYKLTSQESLRVQKTLFHEKQMLIENCLFGVDINPNSVKICRLRLWIELLKNAYYNDADNTQLETLPNIDINIKCGNSLISRFKLNENLKKHKATIEEYKTLIHAYQLVTEKDEKQAIVQSIQQLQAIFFKGLVTNNAEKNKLKDLMAQLAQLNQFSLIEETAKEKKEREKQQQKIEAHIAKVETEINQIHSNKVYENAFEWRFEFPDVLNDDGDFIGFDVIIGNPPYIQIQNFSGQDVQVILESKDYETFEKTGDIYALFFEMGIHLLKENGLLSFITSNKWLRAGYGKSLRHFLATKTQPLKLIDFAGYQVFDSATVDASILLTQNALPNKPILDACSIENDFTEKTNLFNYAHERFQEMPLVSESTWIISSDIERQLKAKIDAIGTPLKEWDININYGIKTGFNEAFIIDTKTKERLCLEDAKSVEIIKPILRGRDIKRYSSEWTGLWLIFIPWHFPLHEDSSIVGISQDAEIEFKKQYPAIYQHLNIFKKELSARNKAETGIRYEWYALQRCAATYLKEFEQEKIVWKRIGSLLRFSYEDNNSLCLDSTCFATGKYIKYLVALLNSTVGKYQLFNSSPKTGTGDLIISVQALEPLKIPIPTVEIENPFIDLVDKILANKKVSKETSELENQIDRLVYSLYDLNEQEIKLINNTQTVKKKLTQSSVFEACVIENDFTEKTNLFTGFSKSASY